MFTDHTKLLNSTSGFAPTTGFQVPSTMTLDGARCDRLTKVVSILVGDGEMRRTAAVRPPCAAIPVAGFRNKLLACWCEFGGARAKDGEECG